MLRLAVSLDSPFSWPAARTIFPPWSPPRSAASSSTTSARPPGAIGRCRAPRSFRRTIPPCCSRTRVWSSSSGSSRGSSGGTTAGPSRARNASARGASTTTSSRWATPPATTPSSRCSATSPSATTSSGRRSGTPGSGSRATRGSASRPTASTSRSTTRTTRRAGCGARSPACRTSASSGSATRTTSGMGETGPAGPCSEILVDVRGKRQTGRGKRKLGRDEFVRLSEAGELVEIWNLVFMQYDLRADGSRSPLPAPSVDTGAGLERVAAVMQGVASNFDTDLFTPIIQRAVEVVGKAYDRGPGGASYRVLADHARAVAFLLADGVFPSNEGRGYVLRRILRRAVRHAWLLGRRAPTLVHLAHEACELMGVVYPELLAKRQHIETVTRAEEERFFETIEGGLKRLDELKRLKVIPGPDAFKLYDTYGFPIDLTQLIAAERGQTVDVAGFERELGKQRTRSQDALERSKGGPVVHHERPGEWRVVKPKGKQQWVGYDTTRADTDVLAFRQAGDTLELVLEENPFYAESGGQVSDTGRVQGEGWELQVAGVEKVAGGSAGVGSLWAAFGPTAGTAHGAEPRGRNTERHHTRTHRVHAARRELLGPPLRQQGSVVAPDRLRFDFAHHGPIDDVTLARIEAEVNAHIWENLPVETRQMKYQEAIAAGAMAFFTEKYGDIVRVVDVPGVSVELCGGAHVSTTRPNAVFRVTPETGGAGGGGPHEGGGPAG